MNSKPLVKKATGELEPFSPNKLEDSLSRAGVTQEIIESIISEISEWIIDGVSTKKIYRKAFSLLKNHQTLAAARYQLKNALIQLGPTGYPFETFMGQVIKNMGYDVKVGQVLDGHCVTHEVDVIASKKNHQTFVECKFHSDQGKRSGIQVALYVRSRVDDIVRLRMQDQQYKGFTFDGWVVTNTKFSADAISFGECTGLSMLSWDHPRGNSLKDILDREHIFPITILSSLTQADKKVLLDMDIITCQQIADNPLVLKKLNISVKKTQKIISEAEFLKKNGAK